MKDAVSEAEKLLDEIEADEKGVLHVSQETMRFMTITAMLCALDDNPQQDINDYYETNALLHPTGSPRYAEGGIDLLPVHIPASSALHGVILIDASIIDTVKELRAIGLMSR